MEWLCGVQSYPALQLRQLLMRALQGRSKTLVRNVAIEESAAWALLRSEGGLPDVRLLYGRSIELGTLQATRWQVARLAVTRAGSTVRAYGTCRRLFLGDHNIEVGHRMKDIPIVRRTPWSGADSLPRSPQVHIALREGMSSRISPPSASPGPPKYSKERVLLAALPRTSPYVARRVA